MNEILFGQKNVAARRTSSVTGHISIRGTAVTAGMVTVDRSRATISSSSPSGTPEFLFGGREGVAGRRVERAGAELNRDLLLRLQRDAPWVAVHMRAVDVDGE